MAGRKRVEAQEVFRRRFTTVQVRSRPRWSPPAQCGMWCDVGPRWSRRASIVAYGLVKPRNGADPAKAARLFDARTVPICHSPRTSWYPILDPAPQRLTRGHTRAAHISSRSLPVRPRALGPRSPESIVSSAAHHPPGQSWRPPSLIRVHGVCARSPGFPTVRPGAPTPDPRAGYLGVVSKDRRRGPRTKKE